MTNKPLSEAIKQVRAAMKLEDGKLKALIKHYGFDASLVFGEPERVARQRERCNLIYEALELLREAKK